MGNFGEDLRKAREARGVTLEAIVNATKISSRYLQAVEQERFDQLPGGLFNKSIVRSYARVAGLDEEAWVNRYIALSSQPEPASEADQAWVEFAQNVGRSRGKDVNRPERHGRWAGVAALLLLVSGLSWFVWGYVQQKIAGSEPPTPSQSVSLAR